MTQLDPKVLFQLVANHLPDELHDNVLIVGSLAAAYFYRDQIETGSINTKDADVVVRPAGALKECERIAHLLLEDKWRHVPNERQAVQSVADLNNAPVVRLYPPDSEAFFIELLGLPEPGQESLKDWQALKLPTGYFGLPCFRYMGLTAVGRLQSEEGLWYAHPATMALSNLLAHPSVGNQTMNDEIDGRILLRSAKDLGRVLALAWLAGPEELEKWEELWREALSECFPGEREGLALSAGAGLRELLENADALNQARHANDYGLLRGFNVDIDNLRVIGKQLFSFVLEPLCD